MTAPFHEIDFDAETVHLTEGWLTAAELEARIGEAYAARHFVVVGRLGAALEALTTAVAGAQPVTLKLSPSQFAELEDEAQRTGRTVSQVARERLFPPAPVPTELSAEALGLVAKRVNAPPPPLD